ncbi:MAG: TolC family protein [Candidatus Oleimicrobiaceae bacterium]
MAFSSMVAIPAAAMPIFRPLLPVFFVGLALRIQRYRARSGRRESPQPIGLGSSLNHLHAEFTVQQLLYDGAKTSAQRSIALNAVESEEQSIQRVQQSTINAVTKASFQLLKAQRLVGVQQVAVANLQLHLHTAESLYRIGKVSQVDVVKA